jgi:hypothetical protein
LNYVPRHEYLSSCSLFSRGEAEEDSLFVTSLGAASTEEDRAKEELADKKRRKGETAKLVAAAKGPSLAPPSPLSLLTCCVFCFE